MRVLLLSTHDHTGGGAIACYRLLQALRGAGVQARMLVLHKSTTDADVAALASGWPQRQLASLRKWMEVAQYYPRLTDKQDVFRYALASQGTDTCQHPWVQWADVVHVHWVWQGYQSLHTLEKLYATGKPVVHTLHDMWLMTGGCYHSRDCMGYTQQCGHCPLFNETVEQDLTRKLWQRKQKLFAQYLPAIVSPSAWLAARVRGSSLLGQAQQHTIPNTLDINLYQPQPMRQARVALGLPQDAPLLLFGAANASNPYKGIHELRAALVALAQQGAALPQVVVFGTIKEALQLPADYTVHALGSIQDPAQMATLYAACDVYVNPSLEENLPNTLMESMSCGTAVVAFATGGIPEMLHTGQQGMVVPLGDVEALAAAIAHVLHDEPARKFMAEGARQRVLQHYAPALVAQQHLAVYQGLVASAPAARRVIQ